MSNGVEEEEFRSHRSFHQHDDCTSNDCEQPDDVQDTNAVENYVARARQRLWREGHLCGGLACFGLTAPEFRFDLLDLVFFDRKVE